jgi:hypothetical protein
MNEGKTPVRQLQRRPVLPRLDRLRRHQEISNPAVRGLKFDELITEAVIGRINVCDYTNLALMQKYTGIVPVIKILPAKDYA